MFDNFGESIITTVAREGFLKDQVKIAQRKSFITFFLIHDLKIDERKQLNSPMLEGLINQYAISPDATITDFIRCLALNFIYEDINNREKIFHLE